MFLDCDVRLFDVELVDFEERIMNLIKNLVIDGPDLEEAVSLCIKEFDSIQHIFKIFNMAGAEVELKERKFHLYKRVQ